METLFAKIIFFLFYLTFSITHSTFTTTSTTMDSLAVKPKRLVTKLLHSDSIFFDSGDTIKDRAERTLNTSITRLIYLSQKASQTDHNAQAKLYSNKASNNIAFFVSFSIGQPPRPQLAIMDTGSRLIWVDCRGKTFDHSKSSTYAAIPCDNDIRQCNGCTSNECMYTIKYTRAPGSNGFLATEQFTFETSDEGTTITVDIVFGCSYHHNIQSKNMTGVFGLFPDGSRLSLVNRLGSRFSYCVGNIGDSEHSKLILGEDTILEGDSTPLIVDNYYYIIFEGISIGEKMLDIDLSKFNETTRGKNEVIIDSGTPLTWLLTSAYQTLVEEISHLAEGLLTRYYNLDAMLLCYYGNVSKDLQGFPVVTLHFADGAELDLDTGSIFYQLNDFGFCLTFAPANKTTIIGMIAQQNYNVAYDLVEKKLYFQRIACSLLED